MKPNVAFYYNFHNAYMSPRKLEYVVADKENNVSLQFLFDYNLVPESEYSGVILNCRYN